MYYKYYNCLYYPDLCQSRYNYECIINVIIVFIIWIFVKLDITMFYYDYYYWLYNQDLCPSRHIYNPTIINIIASIDLRK